VLFIFSMQLFALGFIGDALAGQRVTQQRVLERIRRVELRLGVEPSHYEPGDPRRHGAHPPTTGARSGPATGKTEEMETVRA